MHSRENSRNNRHNEPSFSSTLLDEIYRSIDDNTEDSMFFYRDKRSVKGPVNFRGNGSYRAEDDEEMSGRLVDKWMLRAANENVLARRDSSVAASENKYYFSSNSTSSDSSGALSSSSPDTDFFSSSTKSRVSCFSTAARPKPVRTGGKNRQEESDEGGDSLFKSKSRALKIYASLRKVKQPISPGGKLTSFINSLFNHANEKKSKSKGIGVGDLKSMESSSSNCSSASSYSRSCLSKNSPKSRNGIQRRVRFDPVSVILNEESESINGGGDSKAPNNLRRLRVLKNHWKVDYDDMSYGFRKNYYREEDDEDAMSDSSSDLFELDHLSLFGHTRFCQELPMYETTDRYSCY